MNKIKEKKYYAMSNMLEILSKNKYFFIFKINFINKKTKKKHYRWIKYLQKLNTQKTNFVFFKKTLRSKKACKKYGLNHETRINR